MNEQDSRTDKLEAGDISERSGFVRWLDNFWYHHKWTVIISVFFVTILIIGLVQICGQTKYDAVVSITVAATPNTAQRAALETLMSDICPDDFDGNGKKTVAVRTWQVYSADEYASEKAYWEAESQQFDVNARYNNTELDNFEKYLYNGESVICLVSPFVYERLKSGSRIQPLSYVYEDGDLPAGAMDDGYGIALGDTDLYRYNEALSGFIPQTTILCLLKPVSGIFNGKSSDPEAYARDISLFRTLAAYRLSE